MPSFLPVHVIQCGITHSLGNEITALRALIGLFGIQQIIGYQVYYSEMCAALVSMYSVWFTGTCGKLTLYLLLTARLEGKPLVEALQGYPASFASRNCGELGLLA